MSERRERLLNVSRRVCRKMTTKVWRALRPGGATRMRQGMPGDRRDSMHVDQPPPRVRTTWRSWDLQQHRYVARELKDPVGLHPSFQPPFSGQMHCQASTIWWIV